MFLKIPATAGGERGIIDEISRRLQKELPGLRGFSAQNMRNMRQFHEEWSGPAIRQSVTGKMEQGDDFKSSAADSVSVLEIRQPVAEELGAGDSSAFMSIGFTHHIAIIHAPPLP